MEPSTAPARRHKTHIILPLPLVSQNKNIIISEENKNDKSAM